MADWLPIRTAPKDGTRIMVLKPGAGAVIVAWDSGVEFPAFMDDNGDSYFDARFWLPLPYGGQPRPL